MFATFNKFKSLVENETRKRLKCIIYDNGGDIAARSLIVTVDTMGFIERR